MKFTKVIALSIALITASGIHAEGWLDSLLGAQQPAQTQPVQTKSVDSDWMSQLGGLFGQSQKPAPAPTQLGLPPVGAVPSQAAAVGQIRQDLTAMIAKVKEMAPAITTAVTNKDFTSAAALAAPAKDLLTLSMSTAKNIQQVVAQNPQMKGVITGLVNQLTPMITPLAAQIRTMAASAGWGTSLVLKTIAAGLEQIPQLLNQAAR